MFEKITSSCKLILCCKNFTLKPKERNQIKNLKCINNNKKTLLFLHHKLLFFCYINNKCINNEIFVFFFV